MDELGTRYGNLTVIGDAGKDKYYHQLRECLCDCGRKTTVRLRNLKVGFTSRCSECHKKVCAEKSGRRQATEQLQILSTEKVENRRDHAIVKGSAAEHLAAAAFLINGMPVYHQDHESGASDLLVEVVANQDKNFLRCQVRSFFYKKDKFYGQIKRVELTNSVSSGSRKGHHELIGKVDIFALVDTETGEVFLMLPDSRHSITKSAALRQLQRLFPL